MGYPSETEIRRTLRPYVCLLWAVAVVVPALGWAMELRGWTNAFSKSGGLVLLAIVGVYFYLENNDFLTGEKGNLFDSDNHWIPKQVLAPTYVLTSLMGSAVNFFGDWLFSFSKCGHIQC